MLGPIPNSLGAGSYNGSFFPHGLVTFSSRSFRVIIRQEICIGALRHTFTTLDAVVNEAALLDAGFKDAVPLEGERVTLTTANGERVTIIALAGAVEVC